MASKLTLGLVLGATLASGFTGVFKTAKSRTQELDETIKRLGKSTAVSGGLAGAQREVDSYKAAIREALSSGNRERAGALSQALKGQAKSWADARREAREYGLSLTGVGRQHKTLTTLMDQTRQARTRAAGHEQMSTVRKEKGSEIMGTVGMVAGAALPVKQAMDFQHVLRDIGNIADLSDAQIARLGGSVRDIARQTNQTTDEVLTGFKVMLAKGMDPTQAQAAMSVIGKTATAAQASIEDIANASFSLMDNLKVAQADLPAVMDILAQAGKEGSFELKDMAKHFPALTAYMKGLGMEGKEGAASLASALQVAMKGAANPEEAATNLKNFLAKATSPDTVKKFKDKFGVNLEQSLKTAMAKGLNPLEYLVGLINEKTGGDTFKMGELFGDMQVKQFLMPMIQNMQDYRRIKDKSLGATGVVDKDFENMRRTATESLKALRISAGNLGIVLGATVLPPLTSLLNTMAVGAGWVAGLAQQFPGLTSLLFGAAAGFVTLRLVTLGGGFALTFLKDGLLAASAVINFFRPSVLAANISLAWHRALAIGAAVGSRMLAGTVWVATGAMKLLNLVMANNPVGWLVKGLMALGGVFTWLYSSCQPFREFIDGLWEKISNIAGKLGWNKLKQIMGIGADEAPAAGEDGAAQGMPKPGVVAASMPEPGASLSPDMDAQVAQAEKELAGAMSHSAPGMSATSGVPGLSGGSGPVSVTVNLSITGMQSVEKGITDAIDKLKRELPSILEAAMHDQQRVNYAG